MLPVSKMRRRFSKIKLDNIQPEKPLRVLSGRPVSRTGLLEGTRLHRIGAKSFTHIFAPNHGTKITKILMICGRTLEEITRNAFEMMSNETLATGGVKAGEDLNRTLMKDTSKSDPSSEWNHLSVAFGIAVGRRRLATTRLGYLCMAPFDTQLGDTIAVLYDCHVPVVLRKENEHYRFIGTCYVHGIMNGEVVKDKMKSEWFDIQ